MLKWRCRTTANQEKKVGAVRKPSRGISRWKRTLLAHTETLRERLVRERTRLRYNRAVNMFLKPFWLEILERMLPQSQKGFIAWSLARINHGPRALDWQRLILGALRTAGRSLRCDRLLRSLLRTVTLRESQEAELEAANRWGFGSDSEDSENR